MNYPGRPNIEAPVSRRTISPMGRAVRILMCVRNGASVHTRIGSVRTSARDDARTMDEIWSSLHELGATEEELKHVHFIGERAPVRLEGYYTPELAAARYRLMPFRERCAAAFARFPISLGVLVLVAPAAFGCAEEISYRSIGATLVFTCSPGYEPQVRAGAQSGTAECVVRRAPEFFDGGAR